MKKLLVIVIVAGGFALGWQQWRSRLPPSNQNLLANRPTTTAVEARDIRFAVTAAGEIGPAEQVSVRPEINGRIELLPVDIGDQVNKGQILFTLDDKDLQTERSSRLTEIERAKLELARAERNFERASQLFAEKLISQELYEDTKTEFELAKNSLERAVKELHLIEDRLTKTKIVAPFDCTVLTRPVSIGQAVSGSGGFNSGTEVLTIADLNEMIINAHVNQADVTRLSPGLEVEIQVESIPGLKLKGVVERIAPQATIKNNIKGYAARVLFKETDARIRPGMTANVIIPVASAEEVLAVPLAAVFTEKGERYVYVKQENRYERRPVQIGISDYNYAEVRGGLKAGEVVALEVPSEALSDKIVKGAQPAIGRSGASRAGTGKSGAGSGSTSSTSGGTSNSGTAAGAASRSGGNSR